MNNLYPKILLMFSGGLDSTGALWKLLTSQSNLHVHHLHIDNQENRGNAELLAVNNIISYLKKNFVFTYSISYHKYPSFNGNFIWDSDLYNFIAGTICMSIPTIKSVAIGKTSSDFGIENRSIRGTKILNVLSPMVEKVYPVKNMTKKEIYYFLPKEIRDMTWSCRTPKYIHNMPIVCNSCKPCKELNSIKNDEIYDGI